MTTTDMQWTDYLKKYSPIWGDWRELYAAYLDNMMPEAEWHRFDELFVNADRCNAILLQRILSVLERR